MKDTDEIATVPLIAYEAERWRFKRIRNYIVAGWTISALTLLGAIVWVVSHVHA